MEPLVINENIEKQNQAIKDVNSFAAKINELLPEFQAETGYSLNLNEVQTLLNGNDQTALIDSVKKSMEKSLSTFNQLTQRSLKEKVDEFVYGFAEKIKRTNSMPGAANFQILLLNDVGLYLSKEAEQTLRNTFKYSISSEAAKEFHQKHKAACIALNEFGKFVSENSQIPLFNMGNLAHTFFYLERETGSVIMESIDYELALK